MSRTYVYLGIVEAIVFFLAAQLGAFIRLGWVLPEGITLGSLTATGILFAAGMSTAVLSMGLYQRGSQGQEAAFVVRLGLAFVLGTALLAAIFYLVPTLFMGRGVLGLSLVFSFIGINVVRELFVRLVTAESRKRRVLVLGAGDNARSIADLAARDPNLGFVVVGFVPLPRSQVSVDSSLVLDANRPLAELAIKHSVDELVVAADDRRGKLPVDDLVDCRMSGFEVLDLLSFFEKEFQIIKIDLLQPSSIFFSPKGFRMGRPGFITKRAFDLVVALVLLIPAAPIMVLILIASLIESRFRDPVFYHQVRVGQHGTLFRVHKFRSMAIDAEADGIARWATKDDSRITPLGSFLRKTRLDELPQLINVLRGQMSLVGPRPERPEFVQRLSASIPFYGERHRVKPGITGWAQLLYSYGSDEEDARRKLEYDLYYVKHAGLMLDLVILLETVEVVAFGKGAR
ncbi:MAG: TIGR03013 family XrtA/PEP-CTERM system glycosyltransferase [Chromatiaceae bacterium]